MYNDESFFGEFGHMRCQPNGNYDPIQCVQQTASDGLCFCIDTKSIEVVKNSSLVTFKNIESVDALFCYDTEKMFHNPGHYRPCEKEAKEIYDLKVISTRCPQYIEIIMKINHLYRLTKLNN